MRIEACIDFFSSHVFLDVFIRFKTCSEIFTFKPTFHSVFLNPTVCFVTYCTFIYKVS